MEEMIHRFQDQLPATSALTGGEPSPEALVRRYLAALARRDSTTLGTLIVTRAEYGYLAFPNTALALPPYQLDPAYAWFHLRSESESGIRRALAKYGGGALEYDAHQCSADATEGRAATIWEDCRVQLRVGNGMPFEVAMFGAIIEYRGQFKFLSYASRV
jgi:hypothetical protein